MSVVYGKIVKYVPRVFVFLFAGALNLMLSIFLLFWTPVPSYLVIFMFAVLWGAADGVWNTMTASELFWHVVIYPICSSSGKLVVGFSCGRFLSSVG